MKKHLTISLCFGVILAFLIGMDPTPAGAANQVSPTGVSAEVAQAANRVNPPTDQIIIKYKASAQLVTQAAAERSSQMQRLSQTAGVPLRYLRVMSGESHVLKLPKREPESEVAVYATRLETLPEVEYAEPDRILQIIETTPNDPDFASPINDDQWHYRGGFGIRANDAWDVTTGDPNLVIAVVDNGILPGHPDLQGRLLNGYDFIRDGFKANDGTSFDSDPSDPGDWVTQAESSTVGGPYYGCQVRDSTWHGTHVAGTIGAATNNARFGAGINWNSRILPVRVLGKCGGYDSDAIDGTRYAAGIPVMVEFLHLIVNGNPARVLNLSLGGIGGCGKSWRDAVKDVRDRYAVIVVSAGNDNQDVYYQSPANCEGVITVAATQENGKKAEFSNFGAWVEISAPGVDVLSLENSGATAPANNTSDTKDGTSMAAPHVAGTISLLLSLRPELKPDEVLSIIQQHPTPFGSGTSCTTSLCGSGIINADNVVRELYVTGNYSGLEIGTLVNPYNSIGEGYARAWGGARIMLSPGQYAGQALFNKPITLEAPSGGVILNK